MLPPAFDGLVYKAQDLSDRTLNFVFAVLNVVLWPLWFVYDIVCWALELVLDIYDGLVELHRAFMPRSTFVDFVLSSSLGLTLFWIFGPNNLPIGSMPTAPLIAIFAAFLGMLVIPILISNLYGHFISGEGAGGTEREVTFWGAGFVLFVVYFGFTLGYYVPWLLGMSHA